MNSITLYYTYMPLLCHKVQLTFFSRSSTRHAMRRAPLLGLRQLTRPVSRIPLVSVLRKQHLKGDGNITFNFAVT